MEQEEVGEGGRGWGGKKTGVERGGTREVVRMCVHSGERSGI